MMKSEGLRMDHRRTQNDRFERASINACSPPMLETAFIEA